MAKGQVGIVKVVSAKPKTALKQRAKQGAKRPAVSPSRVTQKVPSAPSTKTPTASSARSKQDNVLALLRQPNGTTIAAMAKATGWQPHSVRGFLAGTVRKKLKLNLKSEKFDGERRYRIVTKTSRGAK